MSTFEAHREDDGIEVLPSEAFPETGSYYGFFARHGEVDIEMNPPVPSRSALIDLSLMKTIQVSISQ